MRTNCPLASRSSTHCRRVRYPMRDRRPAISSFSGPPVSACVFGYERSGWRACARYDGSYGPSDSPWSSAATPQEDKIRSTPPPTMGHPLFSHPTCPAFDLQVIEQKGVRTDRPGQRDCWAAATIWGERAVQQRGRPPSRPVEPSHRRLLDGGGEKRGLESQASAEQSDWADQLHPAERKDGPRRASWISRRRQRLSP